MPCWPWWYCPFKWHFIYDCVHQFFLSCLIVTFLLCHEFNTNRGIGAWRTLSRLPWLKLYGDMQNVSTADKHDSTVYTDIKRWPMLYVPFYLILTISEDFVEIKPKRWQEFHARTLKKNCKNKWKRAGLKHSLWPNKILFPVICPCQADYAAHICLWPQGRPYSTRVNSTAHGFIGLRFNSCVCIWLVGMGGSIFSQQIWRMMMIILTTKTHFVCGGGGIMGLNTRWKLQNKIP